MSSDHISMEPMRAYLLGKLDASEADALEDRYFTDRKVLLRLDACEQSLLDSYLSGKLSAEDRELFEQKYLQVPELTRRLDEARRRRNQAIPVRSSAPIWLRPAFAALLIAVIFAGGAIYLRTSQHPQAVPPSGSQASPTVTPFLFITLTPGRAKGSGSGTEITLPAGNQKLRFQLEIPGNSSRIDCLADIAVFDNNGRRVPVWKSSGSLAAQPVSGGTRITFDVDSGLFHHADYVATLRHPGSGDPVETYLFRVSQ